MRALLAALPLLISVAVHASPIQVPDACAGNVSPCLIRTAETEFRFQLNGLQVKVLPQSIVKVNSSDKAESFEVLEGRLHITDSEAWKSVLVLNQIPQPKAAVLVSRFSDQLKILRLHDFNLSEYRIQAKSEPKVLKSGFANKKDFIHFSKYYFQRAAEYKKFLFQSAQMWKHEFARQNEAQTKVLRRGIASVEEEKRRQGELAEKNVQQLKKVRDEFFYRTFHR